LHDEIRKSVESAAVTELNA